MINIGKYENCVCQSRGNPHALCDGALIFEENGIKTRLIPKHGEEAKALVIDGCICNDKKRCDGMFLLKGNQKCAALLVELKGIRIDEAAEQLAWTKNNRIEYKEIIELFVADCNRRVYEHAFIISNYIPTKRELIQYENQYQIRIKSIVHSEPTKPIPDLREYL